MKSKEKISQIEARLRKKAAEIWEVEEEKLKDFDPLVNLLLGACASEFARVYDLLEDADAAVLERLAQVTLPEVMIGPKPGHSILFAQPTSNNVLLKRNKSRIYVPNHRLKNSEEEKDIYFSPIRDFFLFNGAIKRIALQDKLFEVSDPKQREVILTAEKTPLPHGVIWLGISTEISISSIEALPIYFQTTTNYQEFLALLPMTQCHDENGTPLKLEEGLPIELKRDEIGKVFSDIQQIEQETLIFYNKQFLTLYPDGTAEKSSLYPVEFTKHFFEGDLAKSSETFVWLKLKFSTAIKPDSFENLLISINAVPIINQYKESRTANLMKGINVFSLASDNQFLAVESVVNDKKEAYKAIFAATLRQQNKGTYAMRRGRMTKMDKRDAFELLTYMTDLVRDERMAFKALDKVELSRGLQKIENWLTLFLNTAGNPGEIPTYLIIRPKDEDERIFFDFWTTTGVTANTVKSSTALALETGDDIDTEQLTLLRDVEGGQDRPDFYQRLNIFKSAFLSRGRVVTVEDIKALCFKELGKWLEKVKVGVGYKAGDRPNIGILKVIKVELQISAHWQMESSTNQLFLEQRIQRILEHQSTGYQPFEVRMIINSIS